MYNYLIDHIDKIKEQINNRKPFIIQLPHPARSRSGFSNEYYRTLWYCRILEGLIKADIIKEEKEQLEYWNKYVQPQEYVYYVKKSARKNTQIYLKGASEAEEFKKNNKIIFQGKINYNKEKSDYDITNIDDIDKKKIKEHLKSFVERL